MRWDDPNLISTGQYIKLKQGENRVRIVSEVEPYGKHYTKDKRTYICLGKDMGCLECANGEKPRLQYLGWAIDRVDGKIKMLEVGYQIVSQIKKLAESKEYGFEIMPNYDLTITKEGEMLETEYTLIPARQDTKLTEAEQEEIMSLESPAEIIKQKKAKLMEDSPNPF